jgi:hypothetical protein
MKKQFFYLFFIFYIFVYNVYGIVINNGAEDLGKDTICLRIMLPAGSNLDLLATFTIANLADARAAAVSGQFPGLANFAEALKVAILKVAPGTKFKIIFEGSGEIVKIAAQGYQNTGKLPDAINLVELALERLELVKSQKYLLTELLVNLYRNNKQLDKAVDTATALVKEFGDANSLHVLGELYRLMEPITLETLTNAHYFLGYNLASYFKELDEFESLVDLLRDKASMLRGALGQIADNEILAELDRILNSFDDARFTINTTPINPLIEKIEKYVQATTSEQVKGILNEIRARLLRVAHVQQSVSANSHIFSKYIHEIGLVEAELEQMGKMIFAPFTLKRAPVITSGAYTEARYTVADRSRIELYYRLSQLDIDYSQLHPFVRQRLRSDLQELENSFLRAELQHYEEARNVRNLRLKIPE